MKGYVAVAAAWLSPQTLMVHFSSLSGQDRPPLRYAIRQSSCEESRVEGLRLACVMTGKRASHSTSLKSAEPRLTWLQCACAPSPCLAYLHVLATGQRSRRSREWRATPRRWGERYEHRLEISRCFPMVGASRLQADHTLSVPASNDGGFSAVHRLTWPRQTGFPREVDARAQ